MNGKQLKNSILQWAIQGKLVPQDPNDEPASILLEKIRAEKERLVKEGKLKKKDLEVKPIAEDEIPFEIPKGWEWVRLNDIVNDIADIDHKMPPVSEIGIPYISPLNFKKDGSIDFINAKKISKESFEQLSKKCKPERGDIVFPRYGTIGVLRKVEIDIDFLVSYSCATIKPHLKGVCSDFVYYVLLSPLIQKDEIQRYINKTTQPNIGLQSIKQFLFPFPPFAEQQRIVAKIEELMPLVEKYGETQEALEEWNNSLPEKLKKSILQEAIQGKLVPQDPADEPASVLLERIREEKKRLVKEGKLKKKDLEVKPIEDEEVPFEIPENWEWVRIGFAAQIARGGSPRPIKDYLTESSNGINWIKIGDTDKGGKYINSCKEKIKPEGLKKTRMVHPGDFLLTNSMSYGRPYITNIEGCIHDGWLVISPLASVFEQSYLYYVLSSPFAFNQFSGRVAGAVVQNLNSDKVADSIVPLPPLAEQRRIVAKIEELFGVIKK